MINARYKVRSRRLFCLAPKKPITPEIHSNSNIGHESCIFRKKLTNKSSTASTQHEEKPQRIDVLGTNFGSELAPDIGKVGIKSCPNSYQSQCESDHKETEVEGNQTSSGWSVTKHG